MADRIETKVNPDVTNANRDPITGAPGSHPVGTGVGAVAAGATGAAIGSVVGPVGTLAGAAIGAVVGAVAGGLAGHGIAEMVNPTEEDTYWRENYRNRPYASANTQYDDLRPAYQHGWESYGRNEGRTWDEAEPDVRRDWANRGSSMEWERAKDAVKDSFDRVGQKVKSGAHKAANAVREVTDTGRTDTNRSDASRNDPNWADTTVPGSSAARTTGADYGSGMGGVDSAGMSGADAKTGAINKGNAGGNSVRKEDVTP